MQLSHEAQKNFKKLPSKIKDKVSAKIFLLAVNPLLGEALYGEFKGLYKIYVWPYRIIYRVYLDQLLISVIRIRHRQDAYK